jgi:hypothetical protein
MLDVLLEDRSPERIDLRARASEAHESGQIKVIRARCVVGELPDVLTMPDECPTRFIDSHATSLPIGPGEGT